MKRGVLWATSGLILMNVLVLLYFFAGSRQEVSLGVTGTNAPAPSLASVTAGQAGVYAVTGVVKELRADGSNVVVRHEIVPGYMPKMTMPFTARDPREIASLKPGDEVVFRLLVTDEDHWIDSVRVVGAQTAAPPAFEYESARVVRDVEPLEIGDVAPDYVFTNHLGAPVKLSDYRGQAVGLTFIFTRCPLPDFCPRISKNFSAAQAALKSQTGGRTNWHLLSMTIDPLFDTPAVLKSYGERNTQDPARWTFLTGALIDIDAITEQVGMVYRRQTPTALPDHNLRTVIFDPKGRLTKVIVGNEWKVEEFVAEMNRAMTLTE
ncbi:MAG: SCO family protein [Verrucomicrobiales bacterium]|nr:SCO family protein [Verrucomicrobiales bacterium]